MSKKRGVEGSEPEEVTEEVVADAFAEEVKKAEGKQKCTIQEFGIMKGIMNNWYCAFSLYCKKHRLLLPKPFREWDDLFNKFKKM